MNTDPKWIEIQFKLLIFSLYHNINDIVRLNNYFEFLSELAKVSVSKTLRIANTVFNLRYNSLYENEVIYYAKKHNIIGTDVAKILNRSKIYVYKKYAEAPEYLQLPREFSDEDVYIMNKLLEAHKKIKESGL